MTSNRLIHSGTLKWLLNSNNQSTEFECCLFNSIFVLFQKIPLQLSEARPIEESYRYVLKEHQHEASQGRNPRARTAGPPTKYLPKQTFIFTPLIRLEHLLLKKDASGGKTREDGRVEEQNMFCIRRTFLLRGGHR